MTILGHHSVGELRDWIAALDYQAAKIATAFAAFAGTWQARDRAAQQAWANDWRAFHARYTAARTRAEVALGASTLEVLVPDSVLPVEDLWQGVLKALARTPGTMSPGDFQDLYNRLVQATGSPIDLSGTPQPTATDADLTAYKAADATIHAGESLARKAKPATGALLLLGLGLGAGLVLTTRVLR